MSQYDEDGKEEVADALITEIVKNYRVVETDFHVYHHIDWESYVSIEYDVDRVPDSFSWDLVDVREIVRENTDYLCSTIDIQADTLSIVPEER